jgi:hypothetical protein
MLYTKYVYLKKDSDIINIAMIAQKIANRTDYFRLALCNTRLIQEALKIEGFVIEVAMP